jgi:hypothetical protein
LLPAAKPLQRVVSQPSKWKEKTERKKLYLFNQNVLPLGQKQEKQWAKHSVYSSLCALRSFCAF